MLVRQACPAGQSSQARRTRELAALPPSSMSCNKVSRLQPSSQPSRFAHLVILLQAVFFFSFRRDGCCSPSSSLSSLSLLLWLLTASEPYNIIPSTKNLAVVFSHLRPSPPSPSTNPQRPEGCQLVLFSRGTHTSHRFRRAVGPSLRPRSRLRRPRPAVATLDPPPRSEATSSLGSPCQPALHPSTIWGGETASYLISRERAQPIRPRPFRAPILERSEDQ